MGIWNTAPDDGGISLSTQEDDARERAAELADEDAREKRWATFIVDTRQVAAVFGWSAIIDWLGIAYRHRDESHDGQWSCNTICAMAEFVTIEGWPAVLNAVARAMRQAESDQLLAVERPIEAAEARR